MTGKSKQTAQQRIPLRRSSNLCSREIEESSVRNFFGSGSKLLSSFSLFSSADWMTDRAFSALSAIFCCFDVSVVF